MSEPQRIGERLLRLVNNPPEGMHWTCPRCEIQYFGTPPASGVCQGCDRPARRVPARDEALAHAGVPPRHLKPFREPGVGGLQAAWPVDKAGRDCREWIAHGWCLLLTGTTGSGKSAIAAELLWRASRDQGVPARWVRAQELADLTLTGQGVAVKSIAEARLLVIDELGIGHEGRPAWSAVEGVICRRWELELPTILTTNLTGASLRDHSAPMLDRFRDGMACKVAGESVRGQRP
jgi:hypothetical protein